MLLWVGRLVLAVWCVSVFTCMCACVCVAARVPLATSSLCESATACSNMHPELPGPMHFRCLSLFFSLARARTHTHKLWVQVSCREGENSRAGISLINIVSDSIHLDLSVLKYLAVFLYFKSNVISQASTLSLWIKRRTCMWLRAPLQHLVQ